MLEEDLEELCGTTPLMQAAQLGHNDALIFLLQKGANRDLKNDNEKTAEDIARYYQKMDVWNKAVAEAEQDE